MAEMIAHPHGALVDGGKEPLLRRVVILVYGQVKVKIIIPPQWIETAALQLSSVVEVCLCVRAERIADSSSIPLFLFTTKHSRHESSSRKSHALPASRTRREQLTRRISLPEGGRGREVEVGPK